MIHSVEKGDIILSALWEQDRSLAAFILFFLHPEFTVGSAVTGVAIQKQIRVAVCLVIKLEPREGRSNRQHSQPKHQRVLFQPARLPAASWVETVTSDRTFVFTECITWPVVQSVVASYFKN